MPGLRRHAPVGCGARRRSCAAFPWTRPADMPLAKLVQMGGRACPTALPEEMRPMAHSICESFQTVAQAADGSGPWLPQRLSRAAATLSTGERQRMQLARAVRNRTTGVLYVLDEPSIGLHPSNMDGLTGVMHDLDCRTGTRCVLVDHDTQMLSRSRLAHRNGPAGRCGRWARGGTGHCLGRLAKMPASLIGPFLSGRKAPGGSAARQKQRNLFPMPGRLHLSTSAIHTVKPLAC